MKVNAIFHEINNVAQVIDFLNPEGFKKCILGQKAMATLLGLADFAWFPSCLGEGWLPIGYPV